MNNTLVMLLAGGVGSRLNILGAARAKPAVPFGGIYRIIDFTLSNAMNSGFNTIGVLTQYKPLSLMEHIGTGDAWDFTGRMRGAKILPPRTGQKDSDWYRGTADAVRQNIDFIESHKSDRILILSGDHIYKMDYAAMVRFHGEHEADVTIAVMTVPWQETEQFGIAITDDHRRIIGWEEKPKKARANLASMGIYVFNTDYLLHLLRTIPQHDFGQHMIPAALQKDRVFGYPFEGYWRDVGTVRAYWEANMDLLDPQSGIDLAGWHLRSNIEEEGRVSDRPPSFLAPGGNVRNSIVSPGCVIRGTVESSILSPGVIVESGAVIKDSVVMHSTHVGREARVAECILDKLVRVGDGAVLGIGDRGMANHEKPEHLSSGLTLVGKEAEIPAAVRVGKNCILCPGLVLSDYPSSFVESGATIRRQAQ